MISKKQTKILAFPYSDYDCLICDGAVRSGKTSIMMVAFADWAMRRFDGQRFGICGKTVDSAIKNIIVPYTSMSRTKKMYNIRWRRADKVLEITRGATTNYFEVFGGKDESSYALIQGRTLAGVLLDEVALMPRSFVEQALTRCSVDGAKLWFNCNPENPQHWFYNEWILQHKAKNALYLHFSMEDNPGLSEKTIRDYKTRFSGVFYERYILGRWVVAEGLIYPMYNNTVQTEERDYEKYIISMDYGILNPTAMILWGLCDGKWYGVKEFYHSGRETNNQRTDEQYYTNLEELAGDLNIERVIVDPSAASFITLISQRHKFKIWDTDNALIEGIQHVAQCLDNHTILFNDCCARTIQEFGLYRWDEKAKEDKPIKDNDHAMDAVRYFVNTTGIWNTKEKRSVPWLT